MAALYLTVALWHVAIAADFWRLGDPARRFALRESLPYFFRA